MRYFGHAYYPEAGSKEHWKRDFELMKAAGFNMTRIGEYNTRNWHRDRLESCLEKIEALYRNVIASIGKTICFPVCVLRHFLPAAVFGAIDRRFSTIYRG